MRTEGREVKKWLFIARFASEKGALLTLASALERMHNVMPATHHH
jgi:hypothetical protein